MIMITLETKQKHQNFPKKISLPLKMFGISESYHHFRTTNRSSNNSIMSRRGNSATNRLRMDYMRLKKDPLPYIAAEPLPSNILEWRYVVTGPESSPFAGKGLESKHFKTQDLLLILKLSAESRTVKIK